MSVKSPRTCAKTRTKAMSEARELRLQIQIITGLGLLMLCAGVVIEQVLLR